MYVKTKPISDAQTDMLRRFQEPLKELKRTNIDDML